MKSVGKLVQNHALHNPLQLQTLAEEVAILEKKLFIHKKEDWYKVPKSHISSVAKYHHLLKLFPTVENLVKTVYPDHDWVTSKFVKHEGLKSEYTPQNLLLRIVESLFPNCQIETNTRKQGLIGSRRYPLEIDIYVQDLRLGFEYQRIDKEKLELASRHGISLIIVPFWWDWNKESLIATIKKIRPEVLGDIKNIKSDTAPIDENPPSHILEKYTFDIPGVGVPMLALHVPQTTSFTPHNWLVFEKYDGMRAIWNCQERNLYSRWGKVVNLPHYILDCFPSHLWLDGELWFGRERGARYQAIKITRASPNLVNWDELKFMVFDSPSPGLSFQPYTSRYSVLQKNILENDNNIISLAPYTVCNSQADIDQIDGEGVILRDPNSPYVQGYSDHLFKYKGYKDAEAMVIKKLSANRYLCKVPKLHLIHNLSKEKRGKEIETETKESSPYYEVEMEVDKDFFEREGETEITLGCFVSFKYSGEKTGQGPPLHPKIYTIREDVQNWEQILHGKKVVPKQEKVFSHKQKSNWADARTRRQFFDDFANENNFDSSIADNWYTVSNRDILRRKGGAGLMQHYKKSLPDALQDVYPDLALEPAKFINLVTSKHYFDKHHWESIENCRLFFDNLVKEKNLNPQVPEDLYKIQITDIAKKPGGLTLVANYSNSYVSALKAAYPELNLDTRNFSRIPRNYWDDVEHVREFFSDFAKSKSMDPNIASNWKSITPSDIILQKGGKSLINRYQNLYQALKFAYPHFPLKISDFGYTSRKFWSDGENIKNFFEDLAKDMEFDSKQNDNWYMLSYSDVVRKKGGVQLLSYFDGSFVKALKYVYPSINVNSFNRPPNDHYLDAMNCKLFFLDYAKKHNFDPSVAENWYIVLSPSILKFKGGTQLLNSHKTLVTALITAFPEMRLERNKFVES